MPARALALPEAVRKLRRHHGPPDPLPTTDPFELVLWENVAYLASPARRREAFDLLKRTIGTDPAAILKSRAADLKRVTAGGILKDTFAAKLKECARIAVERFGGDLAEAVRGPVSQAKRALRAFPGIGEPGAEKILLFTGREATLAPESNGLRVLVRLGLVKEEKSYARTYAASRQAAATLPAKPAAHLEAHLLLQHHGRTLCKNAAPDCPSCPLLTGCAFGSSRRDTLRGSPSRPASTKSSEASGRGRARRR